jgi:alpha-methylacyl-CoA racemase
MIPNIKKSAHAPCLDPPVSQSLKAPAPHSGPLTGIRVVDMSRLAPGPYATMLLADMGADVIGVGGGRAGVPIPELSRGKRLISLDLRTEDGRRALGELVKTADVFVEGFRPGVATRIGAGYEELSNLNPRLIYCSLTGYGQTGPRAQEAGHDINYLAISGVLGMLGPQEHPPVPPLNLVADFAGGSLFAAFGIVSALYERERSGRGQYIDAAMVEGCLSMMAMYFPLWKSNVIPARGKGLFDAPFYRTYECADGRFVAVGALERGFFETLWQSLAQSEPPDHMDTALWPMIERTLAAAFKTGDRDDWATLFVGGNACVTPVLEPDEVTNDVQFRERHRSAVPDPVPVTPRFDRTAGAPGQRDNADHTRAVLAQIGLLPADIERIVTKTEDPKMTGLDWPPRFITQTNRRKTGGSYERHGPGHL